MVALQTPGGGIEFSSIASLEGGLETLQDLRYFNLAYASKLSNRNREWNWKALCDIG
ncbi:hypothetical protein SH467x_004100 [Pirellulaceae bacterium SH467]